MSSSVRILCTKNWSNLARAQDELFHADWSGDSHNVSLECTWNVCWHCHLFVELRWPETEKTHEEHCCQRGPLCWPCLLNTEDSGIQIALTRRLVWQDHIAQLFGHSEQSGALILIDLLRSPKDQDQLTILDTNSIWQNLTMQLPMSRCWHAGYARMPFWQFSGLVNQVSVCWSAVAYGCRTGLKRHWSQSNPHERPEQEVWKNIWRTVHVDA